MKIVLRKTSLVDFPGCVSSVIFTSGCNLRCPWCHNRDLVLGNETEELITLEAGLAHIRKRQPVLGGVVLSGGEPCLLDKLPHLAASIKELRLKVKLDTNGLYPAMLEKLFSQEESRPDYIALDLKIAPARYGELASTPQAIGLDAKLTESAALLRASGIAHEYRTLALPNGFISEKDIEALAPLADGAPWYFRPFRGGNCLDPAWDDLEAPETGSQSRLKTLTETLAGKARALGKNGISQ